MVGTCQLLLFKAGLLLASTDVFVVEIPHVSGVDPSLAILSSSALVTVLGSMFSQRSTLSCHWADEYVTSAVFISDKSVVCTIHPSLLAGNVSLHISNDGYVKSAASTPLLISLPPTVMKVLPSSSSHLGGLAVTIFGNGFSGHSSGLLCVFGDVSAIANVINNSVAVCLTAAHAVGRVRLSVKVHGSLDFSGQVSFDFTSSSVHY